MRDPKHYYYRVVRRHLSDIKTQIKKSKNIREKERYELRYSVQLNCYAEALNIAPEILNKTIRENYRSNEMNRGTEQHKLWLFDLAHGDLEDEQILSGWLKYYALEDFVIGNILTDIKFHTIYGQEAAVYAIKEVKRVVEKEANKI